jgi:acetoin utilization deacetylase AcuC-like enzyme
VGTGAGEGRTVNVPLEVGATDGDYQVVFDAVVLPILRQFGPDLVLVSAGFDAHEQDPLGGMRVTTAGFAAMTAALRALAEEMCGGRLVAVTEGGYNLRALAECLRSAVHVLSDESAPPVEWPGSPIASSRGQVAANATRAALTRYWKL